MTRLLDVAEHNRDRVLTAVRAAAASSGAQRQIVEPTLPGARNGGDVMVHLRFDAESQWHCAEPDFAALLEDPAIIAINGACYSGAASCTGATGTVYRALLMCVLPGTDGDTVARFEDELRLMPRYIKTITAWQLSRVERAVGMREWTHVFEQEFTDVDGLTGAYLMHPIHWAVVDRWFDPECPEVIIRNPVCHSFCAITDPVLS